MSTAIVGFAAALIAALIGAGWQIVTRLGVTTAVIPADLALIRYCVPALLLSPILLRHGVFVSGAHPLLVTAMVVGGGFPFGLLVMLGARHAPVSHIAVLIPGTMPIFVAALAWAILGERLSKQKLFAFGVIAAGVVLVGWEALATMGAETVTGDLILLAAAALWGLYSVAFRRIGVSPWQAAAVIAFWSALLAVMVWALTQKGGLWQTPPTHLVVQLFWQGILAGAVGMWVYGVAIGRIGAANAAATGALVPGLAAAGGWLVLGEVPSTLGLVGIGLTVAGVALANIPMALNGQGRD